MCFSVTIGEISGSHGGEYEDDCLLGCCAPCSLVEVYQRASIIRLIALMMEAASASETFYQTTRRDNPEDSHLLLRQSEETALLVTTRIQMNLSRWMLRHRDDH
jgi:hypothetical protein